MPVKSDIAATAARDDQLATVMLSESPDEGMAFKHFERFANKENGFRGLSRILLCKELEDLLQIAERLLGVDYLRHFLALGRAVLVPAILESK